ncbi:tRNA pseudouridine(55) synthase TruB [Halomonas sp. 328]|uniref:tRNA pseudouridine(55) synthase TruB n=1 Tax=Halomonas sp. 328 TaxID=2776704 RepID=UPI0018A70721|nr:tRNA pseudouridine(55) synthase TruB [Halomonas sp. 328]MBF8223707.1 tRNA pseudouridine(55) synthase TruB [Halomonas sp. 328]
MARRRRGLPIDGVLLLDKPQGLSSNQALQRARRLYQAQKAGHTGTLDPMATGLLPVCFGEATKFSSQLLDADKVYRARLRLGVTTTTGDAEGEVLRERPVPVLDEAAIEAVLTRFRGEIDQLPPMYSALKHQGRPLYELAREGKTIERAVRRVTVYDVRLLALAGEEFTLEASVSKGTYIRTLAEDIGEVLGCGAHLTALRRLKTGPFTAEGMLTLEALEGLDEAERQAHLLPMDVLVAHLPSLTVGAEAVKRLTHGQSARLEVGEPAVESTVRLYHDGAFLGLGVVTGPQEVAPKRLLSSAAAS